MLESKRMWPGVLVLVVFALVLAEARSNAGAGKLTVASAASLTFPLKEIAAGFEESTGAEVVLSFGSTGTLARQIRQGAPFDLFFSADIRHVEELVEAGRIISGTVVVYAHGTIVLVTNKKTLSHVSAVADLLGSDVKRLAIANPMHAPYGMAAKEALTAAGLWDALAPRIVYGENVRQTLKYVQTGDAQAGIVALSVAGVPEVAHFPIDRSSYAPIEQAAGVVKGTGSEELARRFLDYLLSAEGRAILEQYGFSAPGEGK